MRRRPRCAASLVPSTLRLESLEVIEEMTPKASSRETLNAGELWLADDIALTLGERPFAGERGVCRGRRLPNSKSKKTGHCLRKGLRSMREFSAAVVPPV